MAKDSSYIREKLWQAVHVLATGDRSLQDRLFYAAQFLERLRPEELPDEIRDDFRTILDGLTDCEPVGTESAIRATTTRLKPEDAKKLAEQIVSMYTTLHGGI
jgi:hypothetical protein